MCQSGTLLVVYQTGKNSHTQPYISITGTFLLCDAIYSADYAVARCLSVCPSHTGSLLKCLNISSNFFTVAQPHHSSFSVPNGIAIF